MQLNEAKFEILNYSLDNLLLLRELPFTSQYSCYNLSNGRTIVPAKTVRDLGVLLSNDCSRSSHIQQMAKTARTMKSWHGSLANPDKIGNIEAIESIRFTRLIDEMGTLPYQAC